MPRISMLVPDDALKLIDEVCDNRTAFIVEAALGAAKARRRALVDAEVASICARNGSADSAIARELEGTLGDGLDALADDDWNSAIQHGR